MKTPSENREYLKPKLDLVSIWVCLRAENGKQSQKHPPQATFLPPQTLTDGTGNQEKNKKEKLQDLKNDLLALHTKLKRMT